MRRKKERSKQGQTNKQSKATQHTQGSHFCLGWDSNPRHSTLYTPDRVLYSSSEFVLRGIRTALSFRNSSLSSSLRQSARKLYSPSSSSSSVTWDSWESGGRGREGERRRGGGRGEGGKGERERGGKERQRDTQTHINGGRVITF